MTLLEIMIVLGIIGIVLLIAIPGWIRQREYTRGISCQENLTKIEHAKEMYIFEYKLKDGEKVEVDDLWEEDGTGYLKREPKCPAGGEYSANPVNSDPTCSYYGKELFESTAPHTLPR